MQFIAFVSCVTSRETKVNTKLKQPLLPLMGTISDDIFYGFLPCFASHKDFNDCSNFIKWFVTYTYMFREHLHVLRDDLGCEDKL